MWHASVSHPEARVRAQIARKALKGVGSEKLGEWGEHKNGVYHLRRRLTKPEEKIVGEVKDLRGTHEANILFDQFLSSMKLHPGYEQLAQMAMLELQSGQSPIILS